MEQLDNVLNNEIQLKINDQLFLETLLMEIRGKTDRSKAKWIEKGEKPSRYFCPLRNYVNKIIPKVINENGDIYTNNILKMTFYQNIYIEKNDIEKTLNNKKHMKSPGSDGFTTECFKFFLERFKTFCGEIYLERYFSNGVRFLSPKSN